MNSLKKALVSSILTTTVSFGAVAGTYTESTLAPGGDFPGSAPGVSINFATYQTVTGTLESPTDTADYFTFINLTSGDHYSLEFDHVETLGLPFDFSVDGGSPTELNPGDSASTSGLLSGTMLTIGVTLASPLN